MKRTYLSALAVAGLIGLWLLSGQFGDDAPAQGGSPATTTIAIPSARENTGPSNRVPVRVRDFTARAHATVSIVRGRTQAYRTVALRSQTSGYVEKLPYSKGSRVSGGETVCELDIDARAASLNEARALLRSRQLEYDAAMELAEKGHRSETQTAAARANLDAARAMVKRAENEISYTKITAPFEGVIEELPVEIGDYIGKGTVCAHLVDDDPMLVVGHVSEREVGKFAVGDRGTARLITGETVEGTIRFVAKSASQETRTFRLELEIPNSDYRLRDGITAEIAVHADPVMAHFISPALLTLNDAGEIGIRVVDADRTVRFIPVKIIADTQDGVWITGPPEKARIITVGHEYVIDGLPVEISTEPLTIGNAS
ncbi:MAG TPA: efflux RND transporter periplasmic adaptor subunit [Alphaproteobacteria bacterium]|nr:efflux RND transporter periplasmic adaptor subunit [Alphaproteobacteria bacterium]HAM46563.1 efflux RND transporter periplasmic adaptor subunit [Alphaproteobacteria bacterium]HBC53087.1 efflux RND transporter periplasmic adaptor subunit [Alphaproteobacteria bacterium]HCO91465.1 efflux RND transporter periplasmic adaptor subunit [Alphaproteobacteria bacterium]